MPEYPLHNSPYFDVREMVDQNTFKALSVNAAWLIDPKIVRVLDLLREKLGAPVVVNNWHTGGPFKSSGFRSMSDIDALRRDIEGGRNPKDAKVLLAKEITARFHSAAAADAAEQDFINRSRGGVPDEIPAVSLDGAPMGIGALLKSAGLAPSTSEAHRLIDGGGVRVDSVVLSDKGLKLNAGTYVVQVGKRKFSRVTLR